MNSIFPAIVYLLCFFTAALCAIMLARSYWRSGARMLLWSALCFAFLAGNSLVVILDLLLIPEVDLRLWRHGFSLSAVAVLLFGFIWDTER